jgi:hypothetical protein
MPCLISASSASKLCRPKGTSTGRVKDNQEGLREEIDALFQPHRKLAGTSAPPNDFRTATTMEKGHGRKDRRMITVSSLLADYSTWPELEQVFKLESQRTNALGSTKTEVRYGVTSLPAELADPKRLLGLTRGHWGIENGLPNRSCCHAARRSCPIASGPCP